MEHIFVCGTRRVVSRGPGDWRIVCATCGCGGSTRYDRREDVTRAAVRMSGRPCRCGAR